MKTSGKSSYIHTYAHAIGFSKRDIVALALLCFSSAFTASASVTFTGGATDKEAIKISPAASTGLDDLFVIWNTAGTQAHYTASSTATTVKWYRFSNLGGGYAEEVPSYRNGTDSYIQLADKDMGYIVEEGTDRYYFWTTNYADHMCTLESIDIMPDQAECDRMALTLNGHAPKIAYFSINGMQQTLSRDLKLEYTTLEYNQERQAYEQQTVTETLESADGTVRTASPLCETFFSISGDRFLQKWGMEQHAVSPYVQPMAIAVTTSAEQASRENDNEQREENAGSFGGSGPVEITFRAAVTDAVVFREWQFSRDQEFDIIDLRIQENEIEHEFSDYGTVYVRFVAGNDSGSCDFTSETYTVYIGESRLDCPNAFSPGATEGTNDEWKVSYKSIVSFDCSIFNRWGLLMCHFTDPSQGWDGKYKGKLVPPGVYYYVIRAKGTDGKDYKLSGDINILKFKDNRTSTTPTN